MTKQIKTRWTTVLNSGSRALEVVRDAIDHVKQHGDTSLLAHMIDAAEKADMKVYAARVRLLTGAVFTEAKIKKNKAGGVSISRGDKFDNEAYLAICAFTDDGVSLIGSKVQERFGAPKAELSVEEQVEKRAKADAKFILGTDGVTLEEYIKSIRANHAKLAAAELQKAA